MFDVGISTLCLETHPEGKGKALNLLHFFFGTGAVAGPILALFLSAYPSGWRLAFAVSATGPVFILFILAFTRLPSAPHVEKEKKFEVYKRPLLWWAALTLCLYCGMEWGIGAWFPSYWKESIFAGTLNPALATSLFWLTFSLGRFLVGPWADRWGFRRFLAISFTVTLVLMMLWLIFPNSAIALILVLLIGFVIAGQYPTIVALASQKFPSSSGQVTSFLSVFGTIGTLIWPPAIGVMADKSNIGNLAWAELVLTVIMIFMGLMTFAADRKQKKI
jgi:fucose permease